MQSEYDILVRNKIGREVAPHTLMCEPFALPEPIEPPPPPKQMSLPEYLMCALASVIALIVILLVANRGGQ